MEIRRILVPTDFSETAHAAVEQALILAIKYDAELTVLHARLLFEDDPAVLPEKLSSLKKEEQDVEKALMQRIKQCTEHSTHLKIEHEIIRGYSAPSAILGYINNHEFDLVVIGTHGRAGLEHVLIGSVAEKVVRYARCPVLTVRSKEYIRERFTKVLVPFDFNEPAVLALKTAAEFVDDPHGEIHLLYAVEQDVHPAFYAWGMKSVFEIIPDLEEKVKNRMDESVKNIPELKGKKIVKVVHEGKPHKEISAYADEIQPDALIIGTHGLVGLERFLLGSTTERVIRSVKFPVLTVKLKNII